LTSCGASCAVTCSLTGHTEQYKISCILLPHADSLLINHSSPPFLNSQTYMFTNSFLSSSAALLDLSHNSHLLRCQHSLSYEIKFQRVDTRIQRAVPVQGTWQILINNFWNQRSNFENSTVLFKGI
jgi:hypothetical protein